MLDRGIAVATALELREIPRDCRALVKHAVVDQHCGDRCDERFGNREGNVGRVRRQHAEVTLVHHTPAMQHDDAVGEVGGQRFGPGHRRPRAERLKRDGIEIVPLLVRQDTDWRILACDDAGRHQLSHVRERPAGAGKAREAGVGEANQPIGRWRRAHHPSERDGIGGDSVEASQVFGA